MGWAKDNLSAGERENIARGLFEVDAGMSNETWLRGLCPIHSDTNPSFGYNIADDYYNCLACGATGDLIDLFNQVNSFDKEIGFKQFTDQYGRDSGTSRPAKTRKPTGAHQKKDPKPKGPPPASPTIPEEIWQRMQPLSAEWLKRLAEVRGWSAKAINDLDIRFQTLYRAKKDGQIIAVKTPERVAIPIRDTAGKLRNIRLYKPGAKEYKIISWGTDYGKARLYPSTPTADGTILLCEGEPDTICAIAAGFNAITQTSKTKHWAAEHLAPFHNRDVVVAYDADQAGQNHAANALKALVGVAASVRLLEWPPFMGRTQAGEWPKDHGQDLTDFFVNHKKTAEDLRELIARAPVYEAPDEKEPDKKLSEHQFFAKGINGRLSFRAPLLVDRIIKDVSLLSDPETGILYRWNGIHWEDYSVDNVSATALRYLGKEASKSRAEDVVYQVRRLSTIPHGRKVNDRGDWACLQNGMLNLKTLEIKPHAKDFYSTNVLGVSFDGKSTKTCSRWLQFMAETIQEPDSIKQFQEFAGYCLTRDVRYGKCLLLLGDGSDGKSTALKILREIVGRQNCSSVGFEELDDQFHRSALKDKLLNVATEVGSKALESNLLKALVTGDEVRAAFKHKDGFDLTSYCKFAFSANQLPRVLDNSDGFFRRLLIIRFKKQFMGADDDTTLIDQLRDELSEIFSWALVGLHRLMDQARFSDSEESREIMQAYRRLNNPIQCFVEDCCVLEEDGSAVKDTLYGKYREYCGKYGYMPQNYENFLRQLRSAVKNLKDFRPRVPGEGRPRSLKGIRLVEI